MMMFKRKGAGADGSSETPHGKSGAPRGAAPPPRNGRPLAAGADVPLPGFVKSRAVPAVPAARPAPDAPRRVADIPHMPQKGERPAMPSETKKLIVGRDISLTGKIASCDRLIVEGRVEAELQDCHTIEIAEAGTFKGAAEIEGAEVSGHYEGSLTVRGNLLIRSTGQVSGTIRYGRLQIEEGGEINGDVKSLGSKPEKLTRPEAVPSPSAGPTLPGMRASGGGGED
jgi:cytoskeletal protein CcmA (bactofilin family)